MENSKFLWIIFLLLICSTGINAAKQKSHAARHRRSAWNFKQVIECMVGRSAWNDFNGYGCWCGVGGWGLPVDEADRCCFNHDFCYESVQNLPTSWDITPYAAGYDFTCNNGDVQCSRDDDPENYASCLCDREMAHCIRRNRYDENYAPWWAGNADERQRRCCASLDSDDCTYNGNLHWESTCEIHGNINALQAYNGIPTLFARFYNLGVTGVQGSTFAVDDDAPSITYYKQCFYNVAHDLGISPALVGALASRLSMGGRQLNTQGFNVRFPFLRGLIGCDTRAHPCTLDDRSDCEEVKETIQRQLIAPLQLNIRLSTDMLPDRSLRSALENYLFVTNDDDSLQFADDVIARAHRLDNFHLWRCVDDDRFVPQENPVQAPSLSNCLALARAGDCSFYQRCMELKHPCYGKGFALGHGENFCLRYRDHYNEFDDAGKAWIDNMLSCTMQNVYGYARMPDCNRSYQLSKQAEARCMKEHGFCGMIEANFDTMREVFEQGIERLYEDSARWREGVHSFMATRRENQLWSQVYDMYVSCMYGCETTPQGEDCGSWYKNLWHSFRSSFIFRPERDPRPVDACLNLAETGDCAFWQCIEDEFGCAQEQGTSLPRHFKLPFCFKINTVVDQRARRLLQDTEQCVMRRVAESSDAHESCLDLEFIILTAQTECLAQNGFCRTTKADEWALERVTALKGYPASMPRDFGKISASGKVEMLTETYYQWLQYLKQQFGQAHRLCFYRGDASSPDLYTRVFSDEPGEAGGFVKFRTDHSEL